MIQAQENEQLTSNGYLYNERTRTDTKITEQGLHVRIVHDVSEYQTNVYEGIMDRKQLTDGSRIAEEFDSLEEV